MADDIHDQIKRVRDFASEHARKAASKAKDADIKGSIDAARVTANRAVGEANRIVTEHPVAAVAAAVAAGAVAAWLFPGASRKVTKAAPKVAKRLKHTAEKAQDIVPEAIAMASKAAELLREKTPSTEEILEPAKSFAAEARKSTRDATKAAADVARDTSARVTKAARKTADDARSAFSHVELPEKAAQLLDKVSESASQLASRARKATKAITDRD